MHQDDPAIFSKAAEGAFWNPPVETMGADQIRRMQVRKIRAQLQRVYELSPFSRAKMEGSGIAPGDVRSWEDFGALPVFMTNQEHKEQQEQSLAEDGHVFGKILGAPVEEVIAMGATSGTTGQPSFYAFTRRDLLKFTPRLEFVEAGSLARSTHKGQLIEKLYEP